jgi:hypothetical protein
MQGNIRVRVSGQPAAMGDAHAGEHDVVALRKGVHVVARADPHIAQGGALHRLGQGKILRRGELDVPGFTIEHADPRACPFHERGIIGEIISVSGRRFFVRREQIGKVERLRCLDRAQAGPVQRLNHVPVVDHLDGVAHRQRRYGSTRRVDGPSDELARDKRTRCIMHQDPIGMMSLQRRQARQNRCLSGGSAADRFKHRKTARGLPILRKVCGVNDRLHQIDVGMICKSRQRPTDHRHSLDVLVLLWDIAARPRPAPGRHDDSCNDRRHRFLHDCCLPRASHIKPWEESTFGPKHVKSRAGPAAAHRTF